MPNTVSSIEEAISKHFLNKRKQSEFEYEFEWKGLWETYYLYKPLKFCAFYVSLLWTRDVSKKLGRNFPTEHYWKFY